MDAVIHDDGSLAASFLREWFNGRDYVTARTSGSTGAPKEIRLSKADMKASARATCRFFGLDHRSRLLSPLSCDYIAGKMMVVRALICGGELWVETPSNRPLSGDYGPLDLAAVVPSQVPHLLENPRKLAGVRNLLVGGGVLAGPVRRRLAATSTAAFLSYGMTETCSHVALCPVSCGEGIYRTLEGITVSADERGCLVIDAPDFSFGRLVTNDLVRVLDECHFKWLGRVDNVINSGGVKLFPEEIEAALADLLPMPFYLKGTPDEKWGERVTLCIESAEEIDTAALLTAIRERLEPRQVPKEIVVVREFTRTSTGKVLRL